MIEIFTNLLVYCTTNAPILGGIVGVLISIFLLVIRKKIEKTMTKWIDKFTLSIKKRFKKKHFVDKQSIERDSAIQELLIELRAKTNASRAYVVQFHNGSTFSTDSPIWRLSWTHETVATGVSSVLLQRSNMLASSVISLVSCLWGVTSTGTKEIKSQHDEIQIFKTTVKDMSPGLSKAILEDCGVETGLQCGLKDESGNIIGYCGMHFINEQPEVIMHNAAGCLDQYSLHIGFTLTGNIK